MTWPPWDQFVTSPGAGGLGALVAAMLVFISAMLVSRHRHQEALEERSLDQRKLDLEQLERDRQRWWDQYKWLVTTGSEWISIMDRMAILNKLHSWSLELDAPELTELATAYRTTLRHWIDEAISNRTGDLGEISGARIEPSDGPTRTPRIFPGRVADRPSEADRNEPYEADEEGEPTGDTDNNKE